MNPLTQIKNTQKATRSEIAAGIAESASWHAKFKHSAYVYVGGLDFQLTEGDLLAGEARHAAGPADSARATMRATLRAYLPACLAWRDRLGSLAQMTPASPARKSTPSGTLSFMCLPSSFVRQSTPDTSTMRLGALAPRSPSQTLRLTPLPLPPPLLPCTTAMPHNTTQPLNDTSPTAASICAVRRVGGRESGARQDERQEPRLRLPGV